MVAVHSKTRIIGRIFRFCFGFFFVTEVWPVYSTVPIDGVIIRLAWAAGLVIFYLLLHLIISKFVSTLNPVVGAILAFAPLLLVFFIGYGEPAATGALTFLAITLLIAAVRGDPGCEVMSIPAIFTGKHTHLTCLLFSPIDWMESKLVSRNP